MVFTKKSQGLSERLNKMKYKKKALHKKVNFNAICS